MKILWRFELGSLALESGAMILRSQSFLTNAEQFYLYRLLLDRETHLFASHRETSIRFSNLECYCVDW